jgi:hypothetical protein
MAGHTLTDLAIMGGQENGQCFIPQIKTGYVVAAIDMALNTLRLILGFVGPGQSRPRA